MCEHEDEDDHDDEGTPAASSAVGGVHEDALCCILHHVRLDLLHHLQGHKVEN